MSRTLKRILGVAIALVMVFAILPVSAFAEINEEAIENRRLGMLDTAWEVLEKVEAEAIAANATPEEVTDAVFAAAQEYDLVTNLKRLESNTFQFTIDNMACAYDYEARNTEPDTTYQVSAPTKANGPSSANVLLVAPYYGIDSSFTNQYKLEAQSIANATDGTYTLLESSYATGPAIAQAIVNAGVVIYDSHGSQAYDSSYLCLTTNEGITTEDYENQWAVSAPGGDAWIDGRYIENHIEGQLQNCMVWMAICEGMKEDGNGTTGAALLRAGAGVVYGYSQSVTFAGDYVYEETFWNEMKTGATVAEAYATMVSAHGIPDPYGDAYPIVMSPTDAFPSNPDAAQTVTSDWTIFGEDVPLTGITVDPATVDCYINNEIQLTAVPTPADANAYEVEWTSDNEAVATVDQNGVVTAIAEGTATITVTATDLAETNGTRAVFTATATINVLGVQTVTGITVTPETAELAVGGEPVQLTATISPSNASNPAVVWSSSDETVATVDENGLVTAIAEGTATISATTVENNLVDTCVVTVVDLNAAVNVPGGTFVFGGEGDYPWIATVKNGRACGTSTNQGVANSTSTMTITIAMVAGDTILFDWMCEGEGFSYSSMWDYLYFAVDGTEVAKICNVDDFVTYAWSAPADGTYTFSWNYKKDSTTNKPGDAGYVDDVRIISADEVRNVTFTAGEGGSLVGETAIEVSYNTTLTADHVPEVVPDEGYRFLSWTPVDPVGYVVTEDVAFQANFAEAIEGGVATITLTAPDIWGDGSGYQMLLDADAIAYGNEIPVEGPLTSGEAPAGLYDVFEYKIPTNADSSLTTSNIVINDSVTIEVPAGTYDWAIVNPTPGDRIWIASSNNPACPGRYNDFNFEAGKSYTFTLSLQGQNDWVDLVIGGGGDEPDPTPSPDPEPSPEPGDALFGEFFEEDPTVDWTFVDADGDGNNWIWDYDAGLDSYEGVGHIRSESYINYVGAVTPDNWAISPEMTIPANAVDATLSFYFAAQDPAYAAEPIGVYVGTGADVSAYEQLGVFIPDSDVYENITVDLTAYAGETISVAFRHFDITDMFSVKIDQVEVFVTAEEEPPVPETHIVTFIDGLTSEIIEQVEVEDGGSVDYPEVPVHEGYQFTGWTIETKGTIYNITTDLDVTANYEVVEVPTYEVTISHNENGATDPAAGTYTVADGEEISITITPDDKYMVQSVLVNGVEAVTEIVENVLTLTITGDTTVEVVFTKIPKTGAIALTSMAIMSMISGAAIVIFKKK